MKLQFKNQEYQNKAVQAVVQCFQGQKISGGQQYTIDQGAQLSFVDDCGFANAELNIDTQQVLQNIHQVQQGGDLLRSKELIKTQASPINLDIEMETGTGKTYCYIKTIFELNKCYGWSKFIVVVPSIAIREGVYKNFKITADHFQQEYHKKAKFFIYNSRQLHNLEAFSSDSDINVMIINMQAFNAKGKDNRRIYEALDSFQSRKPIDVISKNRPILILDEPQKMEGKSTLENLTHFKPLFMLRYSATHKTQHNLVHRLDAVDAFKQHLVKKIAVRGIRATNFSGTQAYLYLEEIEVSTEAPVARLHLEVKQKSGIKRVWRKVKKGDDLHVLSKGLSAYKGFVVSDINARDGVVEFQNNQLIHLGEAAGNIEENGLRQIQIREAIRAHFANERHLFECGIKTLSLFFIDEVAKYRIYPQNQQEKSRTANNKLQHDVEAQLSGPSFKNKTNRSMNKVVSVGKTDSLIKKGIEYKVNPQGQLVRGGETLTGDSPDRDSWTKGEYAQIFESEYNSILQEILSKTQNKDYKKYLENMDAAQTHNGYFSQDKKTGHMMDSQEQGRGENKECRDTDAYDLILKDKERLLSFEEPVRFIFSHSALREGWDNPNVFVICALRHSRHNISRRQEIGRGMRLCVDAQGVRQDDEATRELNLLTVVANESYKDFAQNLQQDMAENTSSRPQRVDVEFLQQQQLQLKDGQYQNLNKKQATQVYQYLVKNEYVDENNRVQPKFAQAFQNNNLPDLSTDLKAVEAPIFQAIQKSYESAQPMQVIDARQLKEQLPNNVWHQKEFKDLWAQINTRMMYSVNFDSEELVKKCIHSLNHNLKIPRQQYVVEYADQNTKDPEALLKGDAFKLKKTTTHMGQPVSQSGVKYDVVGRVTSQVGLTRKTVARILSGLDTKTFSQLNYSPELFIDKAIKLIASECAATIIKHLSYDHKTGEYSTNLFTDNQVGVDVNNENYMGPFKKHIHEYAYCESGTEKQMARDLEAGQEVVVYAKLPRGFKILTPVGDYVPDWAIALNEEKVKHIYFVAETKGSMSSFEFQSEDPNLRGHEKDRIKCAEKFFQSIQKTHKSNIKYGVVKDYEQLMSLVKP